MENAPSSDATLSLVVIIRHPDDTPDALLSALAQQQDITRTSVLLVDGRLPAPDDDPAADHPWLTIIRAPGKSMPHLKAIGTAAAKTRAIAFLEPRAIPGPDWLMQVYSAIAAHPGAALGGGVEFAGAPTPANQAAFAFEYGLFTNENITAGSVRDLSANNMILPSGPLRSLCGDILKTEGLNKPFCQQRLSEGGIPIILVANMAVALHSNHRLWPLLKTRFSYARCFGGTRDALCPGPRRWLYRIGAPAVPFILFWRHSGTLRRINVGHKNASGYFALAALCIAWAAGEATGSWSGTAKACEDLY